MIIDFLSDIDRYLSLFQDVGSFPELIDRFKSLPPGRYEMGNGFAMVQEGNTAFSDEISFESHEKYVDLQVLLEGSELLVWNHTKLLAATTPYNKDKDITMFSGPGIAIPISADMFYILFPWDGHKACCHSDVQTNYRKLVLKIPVSEMQISIQ